MKFSHEDIARYAPPGASVWRSRKRAIGWNGHLPPFKRCSATYAKYGEDEAPFVMLRELWKLYCFQEQMDLKDVPVKGLFKEPSKVSHDEASTS